MSRGGHEQGVILLVEDDGEVRSALRRDLRARGYLVLTAEDTEEAAELAGCLACPGPHLILTDLELPTLEGLVGAAGEHPRLRGVPVVAVAPEYEGPRPEGVTVVSDYEELAGLMKVS